MAPFLSLLYFALSAPILLTLGSVIKHVGCSTSNIKISTLPPPLTPPPNNTKLVFVAIGVGTQNYTCGNTSTYTNVGALAEMLDISCFGNTPLFDAIPDMAIAAWNATPSAITTSDVISIFRSFKNTEALGQHYFVPTPDGGTGSSAKWDFTSSAFKDSNAFVVAAKVNQATAPTGPQDVDWVNLKRISGDLAQVVYRTDTRLGQPPSTCTPGSPEIEVKYVAKYWFYRETL